MATRQEAREAKLDALHERLTGASRPSPSANKDGPRSPELKPVMSLV
jgi:hypothetical protein